MKKLMYIAVAGIVALAAYRVIDGHGGEDDLTGAPDEDKAGAFREALEKEGDRQRKAPQGQVDELAEYYRLHADGAGAANTGGAAAAGTSGAVRERIGDRDYDENGRGAGSPGQAPLSPAEEEAHAEREQMEQLQKAWGKLRKGNHFEAMALFDEMGEEVLDDPTVCTGLGYTYYQLNMTTEVAALEDCLQRAASAGYGRAIWLLDKLDRYAEVEEEFELVSSEHFVASYDVHEVGEAPVSQILALLEKCYEEFRTETSLTPQGPIAAVVYSVEQFNEATDMPEWVSGIYDSKIRVPVEAMTERPVSFAKTLKHEYIHAVTDDLTMRRLPTWMREGMAKYFASQHINDERVVSYIRKIGTPLNLEQLGTAFYQMEPQIAVLAYRQSYSMFRRLIDGRGVYNFVSLMTTMETTPRLEFSDAFAGVYRMTPGDHYNNWLSKLGL